MCTLIALPGFLEDYPVIVYLLLLSHRRVRADELDDDFNGRGRLRVKDTILPG